MLTNPKQKQSINEYTLAYGGRLMGGFLVLPLTFFITFTNVSIDYGIILFSSTILNAIATVTALKAVKYGDLSLV